MTLKPSTLKLAPLSLTPTDRDETGAVDLQDQATYGPIPLTGTLRYTLSLSVVNVTGRQGFETYQSFAFAVVMPTPLRSGYVTLSARR
jgi:hypothetical protein